MKLKYLLTKLSAKIVNEDGSWTLVEYDEKPKEFTADCGCKFRVYRNQEGAYVTERDYCKLHEPKVVAVG